MRCPLCGQENIQGVDLCEACGADLAGLDLPEAGRGLGGRLLNGRVDELPMRPALVAEPGDRVADAVRRMREAREGCVLIVRDGAVCGIFTERDVLTRVVRTGRDPEATRLEEVMTPEPLILEPSDPPAWAVHRMVAQHLRHIPVVDGAELRGFVSVRSVLRHLETIVAGLAG